jgi:dienelactone hydrolase
VTDLDQTGAATSTTRVDHIPVICVSPSPRRTHAPLALWMPALGTNKEWVVPFLDELASAGFIAVSFDPWQHGERATETSEQIRDRVYGDFRRHMWPILGQTTLDALRVIDWAIDTLDAGPDVVAGGVSMGGDDALALAGIDHRVTRVAAIVATPDWIMPGMHDPGQPAGSCRKARPTPTPSGSTTSSTRSPTSTPTPTAPRSPLRAGKKDTHVPADGAVRFRDALQAAHSPAGERIRVTAHPAVSHSGAANNPEIRERCLRWLLGSDADDRG